MKVCIERIVDGFAEESLCASASWREPRKALSPLRSATALQKKIERLRSGSAEANH
jgi:hypothetical protein